MATFEETYQKYNDNRTNAINDMYDAQKQNQLAQLEDAYKQNVQSQEQAISKIDPAYQQKANDLAAQYERNRRNFNQQAAGNGLNTGTASQAALAQNSAYQRDMGNLRTAQADAMNDAQQRLASLEQQYKSSVAQAIASNDYDRAKALMDEYSNQENRDRSTAQTLAAYGDFSGYERLYGSDVANNMAALWKAQNPGLAYNTGRMTAEEYKTITGKYPDGYTPTQAPTYTPLHNPTPKPNPEPGTGGSPLSGIDPNDIRTLPEEARRIQIKGLLDTLYQGNAAAHAKAFNYIGANQDYFTNDELSNIANAINDIQMNQHYGGYNR